MNNKLTVQMLIDSLSQYPMDAPVEISVRQYNKVFPIAYCIPNASPICNNAYVTMKDNINVRLDITLPCDDDTFMVTSTRKKN
jgi:hypothetical protein